MHPGHVWPDGLVPVSAGAKADLPVRVRGDTPFLGAGNGTWSLNTRFCAAIDAGAGDLEAKRLGSQDCDSVHPRRNVFCDAQREVVVAARRYANRRVPLLARPRLQVTDSSGRRPTKQRRRAQA
jgi:hypothetical protein